jgi:hypothetical protein
VFPVKPLDVWPEMPGSEDWFAAKSPPERRDSAASESEVMVPVPSSMGLVVALGSLVTWSGLWLVGVAWWSEVLMVGLSVTRRHGLGG